MNKRQITSIAANIGLLLIAAAIATPIIVGGFFEDDLHKWLAVAGAAIYLIATLFRPALPGDAPIAQRRWNRIDAWTAIIIAAGAAMLFTPYTTVRDWIAFTLAGAVLKIICFFRAMRPFK